MCATKSPVPPGTTSMPDTAHPSGTAGAPVQAGAAGTTVPAAPDAAVYGAAPAQPPVPAPAPAKPTGIEAEIAALADNLSACADTLHERIMHAIRQRQHGDAAAASDGDLAHGITQEAAQALFDQEVLLRQSANILYVQAAVLASTGLGSVRQALMDVTAGARDTLRHVAKVQALVSLVADLVTLAGALAAGKPGQWPAAIRQVRDRVTALRGNGQA